MLKRIKQYLDYKGIAVSAFEKSIGMSNASFGKSLKTGGTIGADKIKVILTKYKDINPDWLIFGRGEMIKVDLENYLNIVEEPKTNYSPSECKHCLEKDILIKSLQSQIEIQSRLLESQSKQIDKLISKLTDGKNNSVEPV